MAAVAALLLCSLARAATAPGAGLKKADMKNCLNECSKHGKCMLNTAKRVEYGGRKVNPHMCTCDAGWVGVDCSLQVDMYLKWFTSKGDAPFPRCCSACAKQYTLPDDYFPHKLNPFGTQRCALLDAPFTMGYRNLHRSSYSAEQKGSPRGTGLFRDSRTYAREFQLSPQRKS